MILPHQSSPISTVRFQLKPYVSYDATEIQQEQFLARDLFNATYAKSIADQFKRGEIKPIDDEEDEDRPTKEKSSDPVST